MKKLNNQGFTLVELLLSIALLGIIMIQVGNIMYSASKLYLNGNMEVTLQTDAQQVIKMFEELAVECDGSIIYETNKITIDNNASYLNDYEISWVQTPGKTYGDLYLTLNSVDGTFLSKQLLANNVASINLEKTNFDDASKVIFKVVMANDKYTYSSSKDVYCRNHIGAKDSGDGYGTVDNGSLDDTQTVFANFEVLRYKKYDFNDDIPDLDKNVYKLKDSSGNVSFIPVKENPNYDSADPGSKKYIEIVDTTSIGGYYQFNTDGTFQCKDSLNTNVDGTGEMFVYLQSTQNPNYILKCYTKDLALGVKTSDGNSFSKVSMETCYDGSGGPVEVYVSGISLADCTQFTVTPMMRFGKDLSVLDESKIAYSSGSFDSEPKFYQVKTEDGTMRNPVSESIEAWKDNYDNYIFSDVDAAFAIGDSKVVTDTAKPEIVTEKTVSVQGMRVYIAEGYDSSTEKYNPKDDIDEIKAVLNENKFNNKREAFQVSFSSLIYVNPDENTLAFENSMFQWDQSYYLGGWPPQRSSVYDTISAFYEAGGEIYYRIDFKFNDGITTKTYSMKVLLDPICTRVSDTTCRSGLSEAARATFTAAIDSGLE